MTTAPVAESVFGAIACATRRRILDALLGGERTVGALVAAARVSQPSVSEHLRVLKEAGLVEERRDGRFRRYRLRARALAGVARWVGHYERYWSGRLAALGRVLDGMEGREP